MDRKRFSRVCLSIALGALFSSCATPPKFDPQPGYAQFRNREYILPLCAQGEGGPKAKVQVMSVRAGGQDLLVQPNSVRASSIEKNISEFGEMLVRVCPGSDGLPEGTMYATFKLSFDGTEDLHLASGAAKAFATGFFTLGILGHIAPGVYTYDSKIAMEALRWDGKTTILSAGSGDVTVEYDLNDSKAPMRPGESARRQADNLSLKKIADQLIDEGFFQ